MRQYIGARYMPKFMGAYDPTSNYEALSVVDNGMGTSYVSNKPVPAGTPLTDTNYWVVYGSTSGAIINLQNQIDTINSEIGLTGENVDPYIPVRVGKFNYSHNGHITKINYAIIDKAYHPEFVLAGNSVLDENNNFITGDVAKVSKNNKATIAINAGALHSSGTSCGTVITDGTVKYTCNIDPVEWSGYGLENLYMTDDGELHTIDAFASTSDMLAQNPVWSFNAFSPIYKNGAINHVTDENQVSPKTVIGQDIYGNYIVLATGGRRSDDFGLSYQDVIDVVFNELNFNAKLLYNCDGGGSSALLAHQIRLNRLLEPAPRPVISMIVFKLDNVTMTSDFESGYSEYLKEVDIIKPDYNIDILSPNGIFNIVNHDSDNGGVCFYKTERDPQTDEHTYTSVAQLHYNDSTHATMLTTRDSGNNWYTRMYISPDEGYAKILGKEVLRGSHIYITSEIITTAANGVFAGSDLTEGSDIPLDSIILSVYCAENNIVILPFNYNNKWVFRAKNISDWSDAANIQLTVTLVWATSPATESYS